MARRDHGALVERDEVDLAALEDRVAADSTAKLRAKLERLTLRGLALYRALDPGPEHVGARRMARNLMADQLAGLIDFHVADSLREAISGGVDTAYRAGIEQAAGEIGRNAADFLTPKPDELDDVDSDALDAAREEIAKAVNHMAGAETAEDVETAFAVARRSVTRTERAARSGVNRGLSAGTFEVAAATGARRLWIAERDACLHCLAYAGLVAGTGADGRPVPFPGGRTFARKSYHPEPVPDPPLHPNCRCRIRLWRDEWNDPGTSVPEALQREALRSVLRGWSLPSESERARLDAASRLLERGGLNMPKSVQDYARRSIRQGSFGKGRTFPDTPILDRPRRKSTRLRPDYTVPDDGRPVPTRRDDLGGRESVAPLVEALPRKTLVERREERVEPVVRTGNPVLDALNERVGPTVVPGESEAEFFSRTLREDYGRTNPRYGLGEEWGVNCQRVVVALELRRRGYDVASRPNRKGVDRQYPDVDLAGLWTEAGETVGDFTDVRMTDEERREFARTRGGKWSLARSAIYDAEAQRLREVVRSWPAGARGWIVCTWRESGGRHIFSVEIGPDGVPRWHDAQSGRDLGPDGDGHLRDGFEFRYLRVDGLDPTDEMSRMVYPIKEGRTIED